MGRSGDQLRPGVLLSTIGSALCCLGGLGYSTALRLHPTQSPSNFLDRFGECSERSSPPNDGTRYKFAASSRPGPAYRLPARGPPMACPAGVLPECLRRFVHYWPLSYGVTGLMGGKLPFYKRRLFTCLLSLCSRWCRCLTLVAYRL